MNRVSIPIADNPNPIASIAFICHYPQEFYVYKNIYKHLPNAEFVLDTTYGIRGVEIGEDYWQTVKSFFSEQGVFWRTYKENNPLTGEEFFSKYAVLVGTNYLKEITKPYNRNKKLVRTLYGNAKDPWNLGPRNAYFDLVLSYGPYSQKILSVYENASMVGNPKFDDWFKGSVAIPLKIFQKIDPKRKTLLFLPTWGNLSSLPRSINAITELSSTYNILIKSHHMTDLGVDRESLAPYIENPNIVMLDGRDDLLSALQITDVVFSDNSGAIFDAILADKKIILIDFLDTLFFSQYKETLFYRIEGKTVGVATSEESLEQKVKQPGKEIGPIIHVSPQGDLPGSTQIPLSHFEKALKVVEENDPIFKQRRGKLKDIVFAHRDGESGKKAADLITKLLFEPKPKKPFIAKALDLHVQDMITPRIQVDQFEEIRALPYWKRVTRVISEFFT